MVMCRERFADKRLLYLAIMLLAPIVVPAAQMVRCELGSPVIFVQAGAGMARRRYPFHQFRTVNRAAFRMSSVPRPAAAWCGQSLSTSRHPYSCAVR